MAASEHDRISWETRPSGERPGGYYACVMCCHVWVLKRECVDERLTDRGRAYGRTSVVAIAYTQAGHSLFAGVQTRTRVRAARAIGGGRLPRLALALHHPVGPTAQQPDPTAVTSLERKPLCGGPSPLRWGRAAC